jgi:hypothetical protein
MQENHEEKYSRLFYSLLTCKTNKEQFELQLMNHEPVKEKMTKVKFSQDEPRQFTDLNKFTSVPK